MDPEEALEEQEMELEALESIYMEDYCLLSPEGSNPAKFQIRVVPVQGGNNNEEGGNHVAVHLIIQYTTLYPSEVPIITVENEFGLSDVQLEEIKSVSVGAAEENVGQVMAYSIADAVCEWLQENNRPASDGSAFSEMQERARIAKDKADEKEKKRVEEETAAKKAHNLTEAGQRKHHGTPVTVATFNEWNKIFMDEINAKELAESERIKALSSGNKGGGQGESDADILARPTGKSLFAQDVSTLLDAEKIIEEEMAKQYAAAASRVQEQQESGEGEGEEKAPSAPVSGVPIDKSLFLAGDDDDLGDLDDLDDD